MILLLFFLFLIFVYSSYCYETAQGILLSVPETMPAVVNMKRLWVHEVLRVFGDRLTDDKDLEWLIKQLRLTLKDRMEVDMDSMFEDLFQTEVAGSSASDFSIPLSLPLLFGLYTERVAICQYLTF